MVMTENIPKPEILSGPSAAGGCSARKPWRARSEGSIGGRHRVKKHLLRALSLPKDGSR